ncbi:17-beta-hydroxysteroid dehydrogenase type 6-like [Eublepharis macularius]|uniref:17-beta-hydroxysteroid dehydrogenase type 6-like n=1 Tax=Eublepharis macularius TaxID=481883 RepID=A0AA97J7P5_EUBMA|nr:17-beta-hydroxysteroid dehydrogenase type 6-like [Eublepharis macularius]XP_054832943.1 17-beta-hydroxysteroid dehydrogenase type 6-like [Eublepharis macularius]
MWLYLAVLLALFFLIRWYREKQTVENLREKYVFITGCDSGFGNQLARQLDLQGMRVLAGCLTQKGAEELERVTSDQLRTTILDVTSTESVAAATEWVKRCVGNKGLWGLVNNAGVVHPTAPNEWLTKNDFVKVLDVNLVGLIDVTLHMLPLVKKARGRVVNVASILGRLSFYGGGYCLSKYGVEAFSDCLRRELRLFGVKIAIVEPGYFRTGMTNLQNHLDSVERQWTNVPQETKDSYGQTYFDNYYKLIKESLTTLCSTDLYLVTDCMEHALTSKSPRTRYAGGWDAQFFYIPLSYLPTELADLVLTWQWPKPAQAV